jgi:hypothetical protein
MEMARRHKLIAPPYRFDHLSRLCCFNQLLAELAHLTSILVISV